MGTSVDPHVESLTSRSRNETQSQPLLIAGITPRCGTNFLFRLLSLHPDCAPLQYDPVQEDFLLHHADALTDFADRVTWQWGHWGEAAPLRKKLLHHLGKGLDDFLKPKHEASIVLTKTPSVRNVDLFFDLFPEGHLLVLVRDGRSVVASAQEGFGWAFEPTVHKWTHAARKVLSLQESYGHASDRHRILYYEHLDRDPTSSLKRLFQFLPLDEASYDFQKAVNLPVYGSSVLRDEDDEVSWQPKDKPETFHSEKRWTNWSQERHARFNWIGGKELARLGYRPVDTSPSSLAPLRQYAADLRYEGARLPDRLRRSARAGVSAFLDAFYDLA